MVLCMVFSLQIRRLVSDQAQARILNFTICLFIGNRQLKKFGDFQSMPLFRLSN